MRVVIYRSQMLELLILSTIIARKSKAKIIELESFEELDDPVERESAIAIVNYLKIQPDYNSDISLLGKKVRGKIRLYNIH